MNGPFRALVLLLALTGCATNQWEGWDFSKPEDRIAAVKCGPEGYHDWDEDGPVCEREGWDGHKYKEPK